jgi:hypothetical protein
MDESVRLLIFTVYLTFCAYCRIFAFLLQWLIPARDQCSFLQFYGHPRDGLGHWTTAPEKVYDSSLFRNGGFTYYEVEGPIARVCLLFSLIRCSPLCMTSFPLAECMEQELMTMRYSKSTLQHLHHQPVLPMVTSNPPHLRPPSLAQLSRA